MQVTTAEQLTASLHNAWGLNRHSVVEVITDRTTNVAAHRAVQSEVMQAVHKAYCLATAPVHDVPNAAPVHGNKIPSSNAAASAYVNEGHEAQHLGPAVRSHSAASAAASQPLTADVPLLTSGAQAVQPAVQLAHSLHVTSATVSEFSLPLLKPLTTAAEASTHRRGWLLEVRLTDSRGKVHRGVGEASPLPGLHAESHQEVGFKARK